MPRRALALLLLVPSLALAEPFRVGVIAPMSGPLAEYGVAFQNGVAMAREDNPSAFEQCEIAFDDSKYDSKSAISSFQSFVRQKKVDLVYNWGGPTSEAVAPVAEAAHVPLFLWTADPKVTAGKKFVVAFTNTGRDYAAPTAEALKKRGLTQLAVVKAQNQYIDAIYSGLEQNLGNDLKIGAVESVNPGDLDFRTVISRIKAHPPQALGVFLISGQVGQFYKQLAVQHVSIPTFGTDFFDSLTEVHESGGAMNNAIFSVNTVTPEFLKRYSAKFKNDLQITHAGNGYDFARYACEQLSKHRGKIMESLPDTVMPNFAQGAAVLANEDGNRFFRFPVVLKAIHGDAIVEEK